MCSSIIKRLCALVLIAIWVAAASVVSSSPADNSSQTTAAKGPIVYLLDIDGVINPLTARYLERGIATAAAGGAHAVVLRMNTPGGLESSMRSMTQAMLASPLPIVVYVAPPGGRAASAGMFISIAAHVAAMAPGTNIGAAHPVSIGQDQPQTPKEGQKEEQPADQRAVMTEKVVNDAAALARALALERGRNAKWAEDSVRKSVSITADEALKMNVIDLMARDLSDLLTQIDGREVALDSKTVTLATAQAKVVELPMTFAENILQVVIDPNIAYLLMMIGFVGILAELYNPGLIFPGLTGVLSLILAFTAFGSLPINWAGVILLLIALALLIAEFQTAGLGLFAVAGAVAFVLGSLMLYRPLTPVSPALPSVQVSPWLIALMTALVFGFVAFIIRLVWASRRRPILSGSHGLIGAKGTAVSPLTPTGFVNLDGEEWTAVTDPESVPIKTGEPVHVVDVKGVTVTVKRITEKGPSDETGRTP